MISLAHELFMSEHYTLTLSHKMDIAKDMSGAVSDNVVVCIFCNNVIYVWRV